jgi:hypothetical protein
VCRVLRFCSGAVDDSGLLAYDAASMGFKASSGSDFLCPFDSVRMRVLDSFETSETIHPATQRHTSADVTYQYFFTTRLFRGHAMAQLVEAPRYRLEGRGFDSRYWHCKFSFIFLVIGIFQSFLSHYGPGVDSASNRNEYHEYFLGGKGGRCVGLKTLPPLCADSFEIWETQPPVALRACTGL